MSALHQTVPPPDADRIIAETDAAVGRIRAAREAIGKVIYGQTTVVERALVTILAGGHGLLIGVPGLAKTKLVETLGMSPEKVLRLAAAMGGQVGRLLLVGCEPTPLNEADDMQAGLSAPVLAAVDEAVVLVESLR